MAQAEGRGRGVSRGCGRGAGAGRGRGPGRGRGAGRGQWLRKRAGDVAQAEGVARAEEGVCGGLRVVQQG